MKIKYLYILFLFIIWGCANRIQPTGGPKDEDPPLLLESIPKDGQRNFQNQEIQLTFNEFIDVKSIKEQLIITPRIDGEYEYSIKKKTIFLKFEDPFNDSTTYTLNFREGLVDITEKNPAENLQIAFSTGNLLDTLEISGHLLDLSTRKPISKATVGIYSVDDTLDIFTGPPYYFAKTDKEGNYRFKNIKDGQYRIYAFDDSNKNLTCQSDREAYSFLPQLLELDTTIVADTLEQQFLNIDTLEILRTRSSGRYFMMIANKYLMKADLKAENDSTLHYKFDDERKGLKIYKSFEIPDSLKIFATVEDSLGFIAQDTFYLKFPESSRKADEFNAEVQNLNSSLISKKITGEIKFDKPLKNLYLDSISIKIDTLQQFFVYDSMTYKLDTAENSISFEIDIPKPILDSLNKKQEKKTPGRGGRGSVKSVSKYMLDFPLASFLSIEDDSSEHISSDLKFNKPSTLGLLKGSINTEHKSFFIQLLDKNFKVVKEQLNGKSYTFKEVRPGEYLVRILVDENENGKWDIANILENKPAEKVILYTDPDGNSKTAIRANWEITLDLSF
ncbi:MAG: Ig-like domain-containing domain [Bacteroidota bacterium]